LLAWRAKLQETRLVQVVTAFLVPQGAMRRRLTVTYPLVLQLPV
jgi:hypothetical protein